jgi:endonuclease/exonuclease/phosphatase family metal-dependent hydrolase
MITWQRESRGWRNCITGAAIGLALAGLTSCDAGGAAGRLLREGEGEGERPRAGQAARALTAGDFKLMTYNIKNAYASNPNLGDPSMADFAATITAADPDIVALQEVSRLASGDHSYGPWEDYDNIYYEDQVKTLSELTGMSYYAFSGRADRAHSNYVDIWDDTMGVSALGGVAILSKHPFVGPPEVIDHLRDDVNVAAHPVTDSNRTTSLKVTVRLPVPGGTMLTDIYSVHLSSDAIRRSEQGHDIDRVAHPTRPAFLMGDMNARKDELDTLPGWINPDLGSPEYLAYPSWAPVKQIDWILYRNVFALVNHGSSVAGGTDSDHQAWIVEPAVWQECPAFDPASPATNFCALATCGACAEGQGDCDTDAECAPGLVCRANAGATWGLPAGYGVCEIPAHDVALPARVESTYGTGGPASAYPTSQTYRVNAPQDETYSVKLRYATTATDRLARLFVDGRPAARELALASTGGWGTFAEVTFKHVPLSAGDHVARIEFDGDGVNVDWANFFVANPGPFGQIPWPMPAFIQAEDYNVGGSFGSTPGNSGNVYRFDDIDVHTKESHSQDEGGYRVIFAPGDWVEYNVDVVDPETFTLALRYASAFVSPTSVDVSINGGPPTTVNLPTTFSGTPAYSTAYAPGLAFPAGVSTVRLTSSGSGGFSLDHLDFSKVWTGAVPGVPWPVPGVIEAENYDLTGGYSDTTAGNAGEVLRWDGVDLWFDPDATNDHYVWSTAAGEYLQYTIDVAATDTYDIQVKYATTHSGKTIKLLLDGVAITGNVALAPTCGWGAGGLCWSHAIAPNETLTAGTHVLRLVMNTGLHNVDHIDIFPSP